VPEIFQFRKVRKSGRILRGILSARTCFFLSFFIFAMSRHEELLMPIVPLLKMAKGQKGIIHRVNASGELGRRIRDMGLVAGTPLWVQGRAPLKDPVAIRVRSFTLTLRNNESDFIEVEVDEVL
jgi:ferrous iron transport protein A